MMGRVSSRFIPLTLALITTVALAPPGFAASKKRTVVGAVEPHRPLLIDTTDPRQVLYCESGEFLYVIRAESRIPDQKVALFAIQKEMAPKGKKEKTVKPIRGHLFTFPLPTERIERNSLAIERLSDVERLYRLARQETSIKLKSEEGLPEPQKAYTLLSAEDTAAVSCVLNDLMADFPLGGVKIHEFEKTDDTFDQFYMSVAPNKDGYHTFEPAIGSCLSAEFTKLPKPVQDLYEDQVLKYALIAQLWELTAKGRDTCVSELVENLHIPAPNGFWVREKEEDREKRLAKLKQRCVAKIEEEKTKLVDANRGILPKKKPDAEPAEPAMALGTSRESKN